jgi:hypothetical protein
VRVWRRQRRRTSGGGRKLPRGGIHGGYAHELEEGRTLCMGGASLAGIDS